jgi:unsaturated rhamnogalacturonyl hydrolase
MKIISISKGTRLFIILLLTFTVISIDGQKLPGRKQILDKMILANEYFMNKWPDPGKEIVTNATRPSNIWTRGVYYEGLMALYNLKPDKRYYDYAVQWGEFHKWGLRSGNRTRHADNQCCGQTYIDLYISDPKPERIKDIKISVDSMVQSPKIDDWTWIDAMFMAMPVFAKLGVVCKDSIYFNKMYKLYDFMKRFQGVNGLYNTLDHLWWRDKGFVPPYKEPNGEDCYWARGNGWVFAAYARILDIIPENEPHRAEYIQDFKDMAEALSRIQRTDGFWNVSLHDPNNFGGKELSGTSLFTFGMAWGIRKGYLSEAKYFPIVVKAWDAMVKDALHSNGFLGYVQGTGKQPSEGQPVNYDHIPDFEDYGLGCFLFAGSEVYKLK